MSILGVKEAAEAIRDKIRLQHTDPHDLHQLGFLKAVATELGLDHSPEVITHVAGLLREHDIQIHAGNEYPKWVGKGSAAVIVNDADEERAFHNPPAKDESAETEGEAAGEAMSGGLPTGGGGSDTLMN